MRCDLCGIVTDQTGTWYCEHSECPKKIFKMTPRKFRHIPTGRILEKIGNAYVDPTRSQWPVESQIVEHPNSKDWELIQEVPVVKNYELTTEGLCEMMRDTMEETVRKVYNDPDFKLSKLPKEVKEYVNIYETQIGPIRFKSIEKASDPARIGRVAMIEITKMDGIVTGVRLLKPEEYK
jgi:hypothetical protein